VGILKRLRAQAVKALADRVNPIRKPVGIFVGYVDKDGTRRHRGGAMLTEQELSACRLWINIKDIEDEEEAALIADGRLEIRTERVPPPEGSEDMKEPRHPEN
jgi:hypothetical protein